MDGHIWEKIYCDIFEDETRNDIRGQLSIKFFKIIFGSSNHFSEEFVKNVVGEVYQQLEKINCLLMTGCKLNIYCRVLMYSIRGISV